MTNRHTIVGTRQDEGDEAIELRLAGKFQLWLTVAFFELWLTL